MDNQGSMDVRAMTLREITFIGTYTYTPVDLRVTLQVQRRVGYPELDRASTRCRAAAFSDCCGCAAPKVASGELSGHPGFGFTG